MEHKNNTISTKESVEKLLSKIQKLKEENKKYAVENNHMKKTHQHLKKVISLREGQLATLSEILTNNYIASKYSK